MNKRIVLISTNLDTIYQAEIISAMSKQASVLGYDLIVLSHFINFENSNGGFYGDKNIYTMIDKLKFEGAIIDTGSFYNIDLVKNIEDMLCKKGVPVVVYDQESSRFESCIQNDRDGFREITEHFIKEHGHRKIYCLSGPKDNIHSIERINGYKDALRENGIAVRNKYIFYGDFWVGSPIKLADKILSGELEKPQSIVCGNDYMALQLCHSLISGGINVPDDIAVGGFDGNPDAYKYQPTLTTLCDSYLQAAADSVCRIHELISGSNTTARLTFPARLRKGTSCGCKTGISAEYCKKNNILGDSFMRGIYLHSNYTSMMNDVNTVRECALVLAQNIYLLASDSDFYVCLCSDALSVSDETDEYRRTSYTNEMNCVMSYNNGLTSIEESLFPIDDIIPSSFSSDKNMTYILTSLHYLDRCFGYCVRRYSGGNITFEQYYGEFCQIAANTAEKIRMLTYEKLLNERIMKLSERDILTGLFSRRGLEKWISESDKTNRYYAILYHIKELDEADEKEMQKYIVSFSQAINLSYTGNMAAARIGGDEFCMIDKCDDSLHPEQLFINTLKKNIAIIEKQQGLQIMSKLVHFTAEDTSPQELLSKLEKRLLSYKSSGNEKNNDCTSAIRELHYNVYEEPQFDWSSETEAKKIGISQSYFQHLYRECHDISFNADVISARMTLAERLLVNTSLNVCEIAERCGYTDASHFMKLFKRKNGRTALDYRKKTAMLSIYNADIASNTEK